MGDVKFMRQALELARMGYGLTSPNPMVGAVVVRSGEAVGRGYHHKAGEPHAEVNALRDAGNLAKGGTLYVNLEPCCCHGRTPPCTSAIVEAGISEVVCSIKDPNPLVSGKGIKELRSAGIKVRTGVLAKEAEQLNEVYSKYIQTGLPFVLLKLAATLDGKTAASDGSSKWISGEASRAYDHQLRNGVDAVMVGVGTVLKDNPQLTVRLVDKIKDPKRIILDSRLDIPLEANILGAGGAPIVATKNNANANKRRMLEDKGAEVWTLGEDSRGRVDIGEVAVEAGKRGITSIMIEGGSQVYSSALRASIVDKLVLFISPKILGDGFPSFSSLGLKGIEDALRLNDVEVARVGEDLLIQGYL